MKGNGAFPALLGMVASAMLVTACGGGSTASLAPSLTPSGAISSATPSPDPRVPTIIDAYRASVRAYVHASQTSNPVDPALTQTMAFDQLNSVVKNIVQNQQKGIVDRGDVLLRDPHVTSVSGTTATLKDCWYSTLLLYDAQTGLPTMGAVAGSGQEEAVTATLQEIVGNWRVTVAQLNPGPCPPGF